MFFFPVGMHRGVGEVWGMQGQAVGQKPDVMLLDVICATSVLFPQHSHFSPSTSAGLPHFQVCRTLRQRHPTSSVPIIMQS